LWVWESERSNSATGGGLYDRKEGGEKMQKIFRKQGPWGGLDQSKGEREIG